MHQVPSELPFSQPGTEREVLEVGGQEEPSPSDDRPQISTLISFPSGRAVPEWRKQLSQRVREVQERKAREAAEASAVLQPDGSLSYSLPLSQLELVPDREPAVMNPLVSKALERVGRARRPDFSGAATAVAPALAPVADVLPEPIETLPTSEAKPKLVVVAAAEAKPVEEKLCEADLEQLDRKPVRLITDNIDDSALSYLENCLSVPALASDNRKESAAISRRVIAGVLDFAFLALLAAPVAAGIEFIDASWLDPRVAGLMAGVVLVLMFAYLTIAIALTGRTLGMRLLSLRTIDTRTGLIPTGGQSIKRAVGFILSSTVLGLGLIYAFIDDDHRTFHDRFSKTLVIDG